MAAKSRILRALLLSGLVLSMVLNGVQGRRILQLENQRNVGTALLEGVTVPRLSVRDLEGRRYLIEYGPSRVPTVLYVFSPTCRWCRSNAGRIESLGVSLFWNAWAQPQSGGATSWAL
jgi:hypothetical protein